MSETLTDERTDERSPDTKPVGSLEVLAKALDSIPKHDWWLNQAFSHLHGIMKILREHDNSFEKVKVYVEALEQRVAELEGRTGTQERVDELASKIGKALGKVVLPPPAPPAKPVKKTIKE